MVGTVTQKSNPTAVSITGALYKEIKEAKAFDNSYFLHHSSRYSQGLKWAGALHNSWLQERA